MGCYRMASIISDSGNQVNVSLSERVRGKDVNFDRLRRITGYLVGSLDRFNDGKLAEVNERVKHEIL